MNGEKSDQPDFTSERVTPDRRESGDNFKTLKRESGNFPQPVVSSEPVYHYQQQQSAFNENYEIKQLIENLRLSNDLESGIKQLHTALKKYPGKEIGIDFILTILNRIIINTIFTTFNFSIFRIYLQSIGKIR